MNDTLSLMGETGRWRARDVRYLEGKWDRIKSELPEFTKEEFRAAVNAATDYDTYVCIHAYNDESVQRAIRAGVKDCVHGHLLSEETVKMMAESGMWLSGMSKPPGLMDIPWFTEENKRKGRTILAGYDKVYPLAKKHGLKIAFGTDAAGSPAMSAWRESK